MRKKSDRYFHDFFSKKLVGCSCHSTEMGKVMGREDFGEKNEFSFGHVKLEMSVRHATRILVSKWINEAEEKIRLEIEIWESSDGENLVMRLETK